MKSKFKLCTISFLSLMATTAHSESTGTINFVGSVTDTTCNVIVDGQGNDAVITLPTVPVDELTRAGETTGRTEFQMVLSDCSVGDSGVDKVSAFFRNGSTVDTFTGRLINQTIDGAENVSIQLSDAQTSQAIFVGAESQEKENKYEDISEGSATLAYAVEYYAEGMATPGAVTSNVVYNLQYK